MKTATPEIRALVVRACREGKATRRQLSEIFGYHVDTIGRWVRRSRQGRDEPVPRGHRKSVFSEEELGELHDYLQAHPCASLREVREHFHKSCSLVTVHNTVRRLGYVRERRRNAPWRKGRQDER